MSSPARAAASAPATEASGTAVPYGWAALVAAAVVALYVLTIAPTTQFWDTSEYIAAAKVLGIPHPPGNPLFVLLANVWGRIPWAAHYALRINLLAAVTSALASGLLFLVAERSLRSVLPARGPRLLSAFAGVLVAATSFTVWNQSTVNEKVYTLSLLSIALVLWLITRWRDVQPGARRNRLLVLVVYLLFLTATNHLMGLLVAPAVLVYVLMEEPKVLLGWRLWSAGALLALLGVSAFLFLIFRAGQFPPINEGEPTTWQALLDVVLRKQYGKPPISLRQAPLADQFSNYWQYFTWQFGRDWTVELRRMLALFFGGLGLYGAWRQWKADRSAALALGSVMVSVTLLLVVYLNFKTGYSIKPDAPVPHEVRERDYFFVASFHLWGIWVAMGLGGVVSSAAGVLERPLGAARATWAGTALLLVAVIPLLGNRRAAPRSGEWLTHSFAYDLLQSVDPYAILITGGDNDMFPLWYAQEVEGVRRDVTLANQSLLNTIWHIRQIQRREVPEFVPDSAPGFYSASEWTPPESPPFRATGQQLEELPDAVRVPARAEADFGGAKLTIEPGILTRSDMAVLQLIRDNMGKRPIYFSRTTGGYADRTLGLTPYLLGQGMVRKLMNRPIERSDSVVSSATLGWIDVPRTARLLFEVYHPESAARERPLGWVDEPSEGILTLYALLYADFSAMLSGLPDIEVEGLDRTEMLDRSRDYATRIIDNTSLRTAQ